MLHQRPRIVGGILLIALAVTILAAIRPADGATAQDSAGRTITIYKAECPVGYTGDASADQCDDNPVADVLFTVGRPGSDAFYESVPTDAGGIVAFEFDGLQRNGILSIIEQAPAGTEHFVVYCVGPGDNPLGIAYQDYSESSPSTGAVDVAVGPEGDVACDWYNVPSPDSASDVAAPPEPAGGIEIVAPVEAPAAASQLVGDRPVAIHAGTCGDLDARPRLELNALVAKRGEAEGPDAATPAEASFTTLDVSITDLLASDHAVAVQSSGDARGAEGTASLAACGEIGGVRAEAGALAVGLREQNGSGVEGIAYLVPDPTAPGRTRVTVFVAGRLAEED